MEFRHLRCFIAVAEELHFARAAERLHMEQSPLSRAIKELEEELGVTLFARTTRSTRLTRAGELFLEHVPRVFTSLQQARDSVQAAVNGFHGFHGQLRIALSDGIILAGGLSVAVLSALMWSLQPQRRAANEQTELYNVDRVSRSEGLDQLPADYSKLPPTLPPTCPSWGRRCRATLGRPS